MNHDDRDISRQSSLKPILIGVGLLVASAVIWISVDPGNYLREYSDATKLRAAAEKIRLQGGIVIFSPTDPTSAVNVDLRNVEVDAEVLKAVALCKGVERLGLDGARLRPEDCKLLATLPQLNSLSLSGSNITDEHVANLPIRLSELRLNGTAITDDSISQFVTMPNLTTLDIAGTNVTSDGLIMLKPLTTLRTLTIDEGCIDPKTAEFLHGLRLESIRIQVVNEMGKRAHQHLAKLTIPDTLGIDANDRVLWRANEKWENTLAGVVEAVVTECKLDVAETESLMEGLAGDFGPTDAQPLPPIYAFSFAVVNDSAKNTAQINSIEEFYDELFKDRQTANREGICRFAREEFTSGDIPKLLAAMRSTPYDRAESLFTYGPYLLIQHGMEMPEVRDELDRLLEHENGFVRVNTICAFDGGNPFNFSSDEVWSTSEIADAFAVPRLTQICRNATQGSSNGTDASTVLADIAYRRPEYAAQILPVIIDSLISYPYSMNQPFRRVNRIAGLAPDVAIVEVSKLRKALERLDRELPAIVPSNATNDDYFEQSRRTKVLEALSATASVNPELSKEIALEYLDRMRNSKKIGPFAPLLSPSNPNVTRQVILELLESPQAPEGELVAAMKAIRDWTK